jgi:hypothetical protein
VDTRAGLDAVVKRKFSCTCQESNSCGRGLVTQSHENLRTHKMWQYFTFDAINPSVNLTLPETRTYKLCTENNSKSSDAISSQHTWNDCCKKLLRNA